MSDFTFGFIMGTLFTISTGLIVFALCEDYCNWRSTRKQTKLLPPVDVKKLFSSALPERVPVRRKRTAKKTVKPRQRKTT